MTRTAPRQRTLANLAGTYAGRSAVVLGKGPSLARIDRRDLDGHVTVGVNNVCAWYDPDLLVWLDEVTWRRHRRAIRASRSEKWTRYRPGMRRGGLNTFRLAGAVGFDPPAIYHGHTSAFVALELAWIAGCDPIWLAGVDLCLGPGGEHYWDGAHSTSARYTDHLDRMHAGFHLAAEAATRTGRRIYNASPHSALGCFEKRPLPAHRPSRAEARHD